MVSWPFHTLRTEESRGIRSISDDDSSLQVTMCILDATRVRSLATVMSCVAWFGVLCPLAEALVITEIHYHPRGTGEIARRSEFVEIYNENPGPLDLSAYFFSEGVDYTFPEGTLLSGRSYLVVAADVDLLRAFHAVDNVIGNWSSSTSLDNGGEAVSIANRSGAIIARVDYNDRNRWPAGADGTGHTLSLVDVHRGNDEPQNWDLSIEPRGTPGCVNFLPGCRIRNDGIGAAGYIRSWLILGPYTGSSCDPCPDGIDADWLTEGPGGVQETDLEWREGQVVNTDYSVARSSGLHANADVSQPTVIAYQSPQKLVALNDEVYPPDPDSVMAYAMTYVYNTTGADLSAQLAFGSDDSVAVLLNGTPVFTRCECRGSGGKTAIRNRETVTLQAGRNLLMLKVFEGTGGWDFLMRIDDPVTRAPLGGIRVTLVDPDHGTAAFEGVRINEALTDTTGPRWVELFNTTEVPVDLSGFHLTDSREVLTKAKIPVGSEIPARGWLSFEDTEIGLDFSTDLIAGRDRVFVALVTPEGDRVVDAFMFRPSVPERSEARIPDGSDDVEPAADPTRDDANQVTVDDRGDDFIVINEIQYHPIVGDPQREFLELKHRGEPGSLPVDLSGWKLTQGVDFEFPEGTRMSPGDYLVVARDPDWIANAYGLSAEQVLGPDQDETSLEQFGVLRNDGERVTLVDTHGSTVDTLRYFDGGDWPDWPDGRGSTLELVDAQQENSAAQAWDASDDSEKAQTQDFFYTSRHVGGESELQFALLGRGITLVDDVFVGPAGSVSSVNTVFVEIGDTFRFFKGRSEPSMPVEEWRQVDFDDSTWLTGPTGIGYGDNDDTTVLNDMQGSYVSVYFRRAFEVQNPLRFQALRFEIDFDDGYVAYLNGVEIARSGLSGRPPSHQVTAASHEAGSVETLDVSDRLNLLVQGTNVLAVQVHNAGLGSSDLTFRPRLIALELTGAPPGGNLVENGDFDFGSFRWMIEGNHIHSGASEAKAINGAASLKLIATGRGDNKVNRLETAVPGLVGGHSYDVFFRARWVVGSKTLLTRGYDHGLAASHRLLIPEDLGTPGMPNSVTLRQVDRLGTENQGPVIDLVSHSPVVPPASQAVKVRGRVRDSDGLSSVTLRYAIDSATEPKTSIAMFGPDEEGFYEAEIPGFASGSRVIYELLVRDAHDAKGRFPVDNSLRTHPLLLDPDRVGLLDRPWAIYEHDNNSIGTAYHAYRFVMQRDHINELHSRRLLSNQYLDGSFIFEDRDVHYTSEFRFAGSPWLRHLWGSLRIRMPKDNPLHGTLGKFNLDVHGRDMRERISHYLIEQHGGITKVPFSTQALARVKVGGSLNADRERVEVPDGDWVSKWYPDDREGQLFEVDDRFEFTDAGMINNNRDARWTYPPYGSRGSDKEQYRFYFGLRTNEDEDDYSRLIETAVVLTPGTTNDTDFDTLVWDHLDVDEFLRVWSVRQNTDDWDTWGTARGKNAFLYYSSTTGLWQLVPWDLELTYVDVNAFSMPPSPNSNWGNHFREVERLLNRPCIKRRYYGILKELVDGQFSSTHLDAYLDELQAIGATQIDIGRPGGFIDNRADRIRAWIEPTMFPRVQFQITTNSGAAFESTELTVALAGLAPADVLFFRVLRNGTEVLPEPEANLCGSGFFDWEIDSISLGLGVNNLEVLGMDSQGRIVDSDVIRVTVTNSDAFVRGDANDDGIVNFVDPLTILFYAFASSVTVRCEDAADADDNGAIEVTDAVRLLQYSFQAGEPPAAPFPGVGVDPTSDNLSPCEGL